MLTLATIVGSCAGGRLRIYYNDPEVVEAYERWFDRAGLTTPFGRPMEPHNALHLFHFHVTIAPDLETLPVEATPPVPAVGGSPETPPAGNAVAPDDEAT